MRFLFLKKPVFLLIIISIFLLIFAGIALLFLLKPSKPIPISERSIVVVTDSALLAEAVLSIGFERCKTYVLPDESSTKLNRKQKALRKKYMTNADFIMSFSSRKNIKKNSYLSSWVDDKRLILFTDKTLPKIIDDMSKKNDFFYLSIPLWKNCLFYIYEQLSALDPEKESYYLANLTLQKIKLSEIYKQFNRSFLKIPLKKRKVYALDDSFFYLCKDFEIKIYNLLQPTIPDNTLKNPDVLLIKKPPYNTPFIYNFHLKKHLKVTIVDYIKQKSSKDSVITGLYTELSDETYKQNSYFLMMLHNYTVLLNSF